MQKTGVLISIHFIKNNKNKAVIPLSESKQQINSSLICK